ncbi:TetR family transcriptional regulator [Actinomadura scrupuli]|uniref:TetR/AcrR family transcriptional regulator n=1 Tax=Actinomadura scrupuli TaxID=559629 RepID=UPI003D9719F2
MDVSAGFQVRVRRQMREDAMDAAYRVLVESGWSAVRMTGIAAAVGVSRQSLYKEFATKEEIGGALILREATRFSEGVNAQIRMADNASAVIEAAIRFGFEHGSANRVLIAILADPGHSGGGGLLPFITTDAGTLIDIAAGLLVEPILQREPGLDPEDVAATCDALTRLMLSHLLQPLGDTETAIHRLIRMAHRNLGLPCP